MNVIVVEKPGGPDSMTLWEAEVPQPREGEVRVRLEAIGVNFIDIYQRSGMYPVQIPFTPGSEGAGEVEAIGPGVKEFKEGDRVAYALSSGAYAEYAIVPAWKLVKIPDSIGTMKAASILLQGMTAHYLTHSCYRVKPGDSVLVHAAAGGVGYLLIQVVKHLGAFVIGTASTAEKVKTVLEGGANEVIHYTEEDFAVAIKQLSAGRGVNVVYDSVGKTTFEKSLECLRPRGTMVLFGQSSGLVPPVDIQLLAKNSLFLTRPSLGQYCTNRAELLERANQVFEWVSSGIVKIRIDQTFPLADAADAHRRLESRRSSGKILLLP